MNYVDVCRGDAVMSRSHGSSVFYWERGADFGLFNFKEL